MNRIATIFLAILVLASTTTGMAAGPLTNASKRTVTAEDRYATCLRFLKRGYYTKALEHCNRVRNSHRDSPLSVLAELAVADIYYKRGDFDQARMAYEDFARLHSRHKSIDYVTWRIGLSLYRRASKLAGRDQSTTRQAVNVWTGFNSRFPQSEHLDDVEKHLRRCRNRLALKELYIAKFYARRDAHRAVRGRLEGLLLKYSNSQHAPTALGLLATNYHEQGMTNDAQAARERLAAEHPDSKWLSRVDRLLKKPAGEPVTDTTFVRPYRMSGGGANQPTR